MSTSGHTRWIVPGGRIPATGTGREPEFTSRDELWMLNIDDAPADVTLTFYYEEQEPIGPYRLEIQPRRVRCTRVNDLIDPEAVLLDRPYALVIDASIPIVVQVARYDTRQAEHTMSWTMAWPISPGE